jgi:hypothetical protein
MSDTRQQAVGSSQTPTPVSTNEPQPPQGPTADRRHQLEVPNPLSRDEVREHVGEALESIDAGGRVAIFDAAPTSDVPTTTVCCQPGTRKYIFTQVKAGSMNQSETLSKQDVLGRLTDILTGRTRDSVGDFYTKSSIGPGAGTLSAQY